MKAEVEFVHRSTTRCMNFVRKVLFLLGHLPVEQSSSSCDTYKRRHTSVVDVPSYQGGAADSFENVLHIDLKSRASTYWHYRRLVYDSE